MGKLEEWWGGLLKWARVKGRVAVLFTVIGGGLSALAYDHFGFKGDTATDFTSVNAALTELASELGEQINGVAVDIGTIRGILDGLDDGRQLANAFILDQVALLAEHQNKFTDVFARLAAIEGQVAIMLQLVDWDKNGEEDSP